MAFGSCRVRKLAESGVDRLYSTLFDSIRLYSTLFDSLFDSMFDSLFDSLFDSTFPAMSRPEAMASKSELGGGAAVGFHGFSLGGGTAVGFNGFSMGFHWGSIET